MIKIKLILNKLPKAKKIFACFITLSIVLSLPGYFPHDFKPYINNPILSPQGDEDHATFASVLGANLPNGSLIYHMYYHYYDAGNHEQIGHATSIDGKKWKKDDAHNPVLSASQAWEGGHVGVPMVWKEDSVWYMLYRGKNPIRGSDATGLATSSNGVDWVKSQSNPVLVGSAGEWDKSGAEVWGVIKSKGIYYAYYETGWDSPANRSIGIASSVDLINWKKDSNNPILTGGRFCPFAFKFKNTYYLIVPHYTSGTDYSELELYSDTNLTFYPAQRKYLGVIKSTSRSGWDSIDQDTPFVLTDDIERDSYRITNNRELWVYYSGYDGVWREGLLISKLNPFSSPRPNISPFVNNRLNFNFANR